MSDGSAVSGGARTRIVDLAGQPEQVREQAASLLVEDFSEPSGWPDMTLARREVAQVITQGFAFGLLDGETLIGWIGGLPEYAGRVIELHPLVVRRAHRRCGCGRALVAAFEAEAARRGALTVTVGSDDDSGMTSLSGVDLYENLPRQLAELRDHGRDHPVFFYRRLGYVVTGVMPDANGRGRPDIYLSKPIGR